MSDLIPTQAALGGQYGPFVAAIVPHPLLRPLVARLPGGDPARLNGTWTSWAGSPAGVLVLFGAASAAALVVAHHRRIK